METSNIYSLISKDLMILSTNSKLQIASFLQSDYKTDDI